MGEINMKRVLLAAILLVAMVALYAEAQRYGGGYGRGGYGGGYGGRGGYGGGRGYYGGGGRGYGGYGRGGYGGNYGGGYGRGYRGNDYNYNSVYPSYSGIDSSSGYGSGYGSSYGSSGYGSSSLSGGGGGGHYDDLEDDDYSAYGSSGLEVYATSSSQPSLMASSTNNGGSQSATTTSASSPHQVSVPATRGRLQPDSVFSPFERRNQQPMHPWQQSPADNTELQSFFGSGGGGSFDLITGSGDQSSSGRADRASERNVLAATNRAGGNAATTATGSLVQLNNTPSVPTSTTTAPPDYVMINPTATASA